MKSLANNIGIIGMTILVVCVMGAGSAYAASSTAVDSKSPAPAITGAAVPVQGQTALVAATPAVTPPPGVKSADDAASVVLCFSDNPALYQHDIAVTAFTETWYKDGAAELVTNYKNIEYSTIERPDWGGFMMYYISKVDIETPGQPTPPPGITGGIAFRIDDSQLPILAGNMCTQGHMVLGVLKEPPVNQFCADTNEFTIAIAYPPHGASVNGEALVVTNVVISDLATKQVLAVLPAVQMGTENKVILNKLNRIEKIASDTNQAVKNVNVGVAASNRLAQTNNVLATSIQTVVTKIYNLLLTGKR